MSGQRPSTILSQASKICLSLMYIGEWYWGWANWYGYGYTTQQHAAIHNNIVQVQRLAPVAGHSASATHELGLHSKTRHTTWVTGMTLAQIS